MSHKIFIIESDANYLSGMQANLSAKGFATQADYGAGELETTLYLIKDYAPDCIILDLSLPGIDAFDLIRELRSDPLLNQALILIYNSQGAQSEKERALGLGADFHYKKEDLAPVDFSDRIERILANRQ